MFLIRAAFWLSLVIMLLPTGETEDGRSVSALEALSVAQTTYGDFSNFCERNVSACEIGGVFVDSFGQKARYGARWVYEYLDENFGNNQSVASEPVSLDKKS